MKRRATFEEIAFFVCLLYVFFRRKGEERKGLQIDGLFASEQKYNHMIGGTLKLGPFKRNLELSVCPMLLRILIDNLTHFVFPKPFSIFQYFNNTFFAE